MDVEPVKHDARWTGPPDAATSDRLIRAYRRTARKHGFPATLFVHPEAAELHADLLRQAEGEGDCLGLHVHPTRFEYPRYRYEFGYYTGEQQAEILTRAKSRWAAAIGCEPVYFRPGAFSANDATFATLVSLGFRGGSVSIPGRVWPGRYCIWSAAPLDPHRANAAFRQVAGDLPFANIPLSVDSTAVVQSLGMTCFRDLRPNARGVPAEQTLRNILAGIAERRPPVAVLHIVTHNDQPFDEPDSESSRHLRTVLTRVGPVCEELGLVAAGRTVGNVCDDVLALPVAAPTEWTQSNEVCM